MATPAGNGDSVPGAGVRSPIDLALGTMVDPDALSAAYGEAYRHYAESVTACIRAEGFEYVYPVDEIPQPSDFVIGANSDTALVVRYGYGPPRTLLGLIDTRRPGTLVAPESRWPPLDSPEYDSFVEVRADCLSEAADSVRLPDELPRVVGDVVSAFRSSFAESVGVRSVWGEWSRCMAEKGFAFEDRTAISESLNSQAIPIRQLLSAIRPDEPVAPETIQAIDAIVEYEVEIIAADVACAEQLALDTRLAQLQHDAELEFLAENGDWIQLEMDSWRSRD